MSGGSYEYLCYKDDRDWLSGPPAEAQAMADRLASLGYHEAAVMVHQLIEQTWIARARVEAKLRLLQPVFKAVEWMDSGDSGPEAVARAVEAMSLESMP